MKKYFHIKIKVSNQITILVTNIISIFKIDKNRKGHKSIIWKYFNEVKNIILFNKKTEFHIKIKNPIDQNYSRKYLNIKCLDLRVFLIIEYKDLSINWLSKYITTASLKC